MSSERRFTMYCISSLALLPQFILWTYPLIYLHPSDLFAQAAPVEKIAQIVPTPEQVAAWSAAQTIQWLLVAVLICVAIAAYFGMKTLSKSNETVNVNYSKSIEMWEQRFRIQDTRYEQQEARHATERAESHKVLQDFSANLRSISDSLMNLRGK